MSRLIDDSGRRLARARLPEGVGGVARLHGLIAEHAPEGWAELEPVEASARVVVGIETDRGPWVQALIAAGYRGVRDQPDVGGSLSGAPFHVRGEERRVATRTCWPRSCDWTGPITGRSPVTAGWREAMKLVARTHQRLIWDRTRHVLRLRSALREFFPAALAAFADLTATDALELLGTRSGSRSGRTSCPVARSQPRCRVPGAATWTSRPTAIQSRLAGASSCASRRRSSTAYAAVVTSQVAV